MSNQIQNPNDKKKYDLAERTARFGEEVIVLAGMLPHAPVVRPLISQFVRSGTSIGANYMEADGAESKKDFQHKISICKKEAKETMHWMRMIAQAHPSGKEKCRNATKAAYSETPQGGERKKT